jgi:hypothetical protein
VSRAARKPATGGGGNQSKKHHLRAFTCRESSLPGGAGQLCSTRNRRNRRAACCAAGIRNSPTGAPEHPITRDLPRQNQCCSPVQISRERASIPISRIAGASHPDAAVGQDAGILARMPGPPNHSSVSILYFCAASQGACDFQADSRIVYYSAA